MQHGKECFFDKSWSCWRQTACPFKSVEECLKALVLSSMKELSYLKQRQMLKHSEASITWRNQAFYYKRKARTLEDYILERGLPVPHINKPTKSKKGKQ